MKKSKNFPAKKTPKTQTATTKVDEKALPNQDSLDDENQGFGGWLRYYKLFIKSLFYNLYLCTIKPKSNNVLLLSLLCL